MIVLALAALAAGLDPPAPEPESCVVLEEHHFDFDEDGRLDILLLLQRGLDGRALPGGAESLLFQFTRHGAQEVIPTTGWWGSSLADWMESRPGLPREASLIDSSVVFAQRFGPAGLLLFLRHSSLEAYFLDGLTILAVNRHGARLYYHADEFILHELVPPRRDGRWTMGGYEAATETFGCGADLAWFYNPRLVYRLEAQPRLDQRETERVNRRLFGGYRGPRATADWLVVQPVSGPARLARPDECPALPE